MGKNYATLVAPELNKVLRELYKKSNNAVMRKAFFEEVRARQGYLILGVLKRRLWVHGTDGNGEKLRSPYNPSYAAEKKKQGVKTKPTTLRLTGDWYRSLTLTKGEGGSSSKKEWQIWIDSDGNEEKNSYLKRSYGAAILNLTEEEQDFFAEQMSDWFVKTYIGSTLNKLGE